MTFSLIISSSLRWLRSRWAAGPWRPLSPRVHALHLGMLLAGVLLVSCSGGADQAGVANSATTANTVELSKIHWCGKPLMVFRDEGVSAIATPAASPDSNGGTPIAGATPRTIADWSHFRPSLGFAVFLPQSLPGGSCLLSASGTSHDPVFGSSFTIGYLLSDHSALSLSEAPARRAQNTAFQCSPTSSSSPANAAKSATPAASPTPAQTSIQLCSGVRSTTNIVFSARGTTKTLQHFFQALRPGVDWLPV